MFIFWLAAAASSHYNCNDLCNACSNSVAVYFDNLSCVCDAYEYYLYDKRGMSPVKNGLLESRSVRYARPVGTAAAKQGLDAVMVYVTFAPSLSFSTAAVTVRY